MIRPMNEVIRMQYLDVLGIDTYMPRRILPGAPPPRACTAVVAQAAVVTASPVTASPVTASPVTVPDVIADTAPQAIADAVKAPVAPLAPGGVAEPRFSLAIWSLDGLLVIDSRQPQAALPTEALLANLVFALGLRSPLPRAEVFNWPMLESVPEISAEQSAREAIAAMLEAKPQSESFSQCLLMGEAACYYCTAAEYVSTLPQYDGGPAQVFAALTGRSVAVAGLPVTGMVLPSLTQMLTQPDLKAAAWRTLHVLRRQHS